MDRERSLKKWYEIVQMYTVTVSYACSLSKGDASPYIVDRVKTVR